MSKTAAAQVQGVSIEDLMKKIQQLEEANSRLVAKVVKPSEFGIQMKVTSPKLDPVTNKVTGSTGLLQVSGLGQRFPVTLGKEQWEYLLSQGDKIRAFIKANDATLLTKEQRQLSA